MNYQLVLFDLDGTLMDTSGGIINSYEKSVAQFGYQSSHITSYQNIIGGTLPDNFSTYFQVKDSDIRDIVACYRAIYAKEGLYMAECYQGIRDLLAQLHSNGVKVAIATLKRQDFAEAMMDHFGLSQYFDFICGMDAADTKSKSDIIRQCQSYASVTSEQTVMIGDTLGDQKAAFDCDSAFIGVTYGFGFQTAEDAQVFPSVLIASTPEEISAFLR